MTTLTKDTRKYIAAGLGSDAPDHLATFLKHRESELTAGKPRRESARNSLMQWATRAANTSITGTQIEGIEKLVKELRSLDPDERLDRYTYKKGRALLTLYRKAETKRPVGYLYVHTPKPEYDELHQRLGIARPAENATPAKDWIETSNSGKVEQGVRNA